MTFRLPVATRDALRSAADADHRTMSNLAVLILEGWLTERGFLAGGQQKQRKQQKHRR